MTAQRISMPDGKPEPGTVFFVYRAKMHTGSSIHTAGAITEEQHRAIALILQGRSTAYDGRADTTRESRLMPPLHRDKLLAALLDLVNEPQDITTPAYQNALAALAATE